MNAARASESPRGARRLCPGRHRGYGAAMAVNLPQDAPAWAGWVLFAVTLVVLILREFIHARSSAAERAKTQAETLKMQLEGLRESAQGYVQELTAVADALSAERVGRPTLAQIEALEAEAVSGDDQKDLSLARHLKARETARSELPRIVGRLVAVKNREAELTRDLANGVRVPETDVGDLRGRLDAVVADLGKLVQDLAESPRVFIQPEEPAQGQDGDLWYPISVPGSG